MGKNPGKKTADGGQKATDILSYSTYEIERIVRFAHNAAPRRRGKLCSVDKANVIETTRLWREVVIDLAQRISDVRKLPICVCRQLCHD